LNPLFGFATTALVVVFYLIFLLAEVAGIRRRLVNAFGAVQAQRILQVANSINTAISHYIMVKTFVSLLVAVLSTGILLAFDVRYAIIWGILTFFANYIPYVGSLVAVILPVLMTFALAGPSGTLLLMLVLLVGTQVLVGSFLEPRMIGRKLGISPLIILLGLAFWGMLWGIPGMVLSSPLLVTAKIILENMEPTRPLARLMSNV
jgi:AI-2 transport protein TqsA